MNPFFSVIIATYNREKLLIRALRSLIAQTETDWEAVIVDDGSTDNTEQAVQAFLSPKIRYVKQPNQGDAIAKNNGAKLSHGSYITFLDSDDFYEPEHLKIRKEMLEKNNETDLLHGGVRIIGDQYVPDIRNPTMKISLTECVIGATFCIKKEVFFKLDCFENINYGSDTKLFTKALHLGCKIIKTDNPTYVYDRTSTDSITHKFG
ncbi:MAG: glycosyltransferase family 2 protein [Bacteroidia bacterium]|nr:glycosyltransferase family 2 protein [Bacteroidia bacterium]MCO5254316.1 glycosyltransferase family 2 protein [Bacteroidota bacterium]MCZ2129931.1 glycosyltransferase family 2 protein [Bacteroidia bacterium]